NCRDNHRSCSYWARIGECQRNSGYMLLNCKKSCNNCNSCKNRHVMCATWAGRGECRRNPGYMTVYCKKSCRVC
ncbi:unnamed protein product, partial [Porites evermanni]